MAISEISFFISPTVAVSQTLALVGLAADLKCRIAFLIFSLFMTESPFTYSGAATSCKAMIARRGETNNSTVERRKEDE